MSLNLPGTPAKLRVLISGHLSPPGGGIAAYYQSILNSSLPEHVNLSFVQTSSQTRQWLNSGKFSIANVILALKDWARFARAVFAHRPQITHIATAFGLSFIKHSMCVAIARFSGSRVLIHPHCGLSILYTERSKEWQWFFRLVIRRTHGIVALSKEWIQLQEIIPTCQVFYLPNAIELAPYEAIAHERLEQDPENGQLRVLYLGHLGKAKGSFDLITVAQIIHSDEIPIVFDLVGEEISPGEKEQLISQIRIVKLENQVSVHPPTYGSEKLTFFRQADVFIYPSYHEGMPMAVLEAMACGLPIVATRVGGLPDLVSDGANGVLVEPGQPDQLVDALRRLLSAPELRRGMQEKSYQLTVERYDMERHVKRLIDIYHRVALENQH